MKSKNKSKKLSTHHDYQNELLQTMASQVLQRKLIEVQNSNFFSIRCDKYTDTSNKEQLSLCVRWVDKNLEAHEDDT